MSDFLSAESINKQFSNHTALKDVSISVKKQTIFGLLGPNGAGKTTLIRIINQILAPDSGKVFFNGEALNINHIQQIGYLPEERGLYKKMKVGEQVLYLAQLKGMSRHDALQKVKYWFRKFEIQSWWDKKVEELSKGMQQKVQFIITVLHEPKLLIFDEPFSGFDPINTRLLKNEILELREKGATVIFSTHNMESVEELCDHIALIHMSEKILDGNVTKIKETYRAGLYEINATDCILQKDMIDKRFEIIQMLTEGKTTKLKICITDGSSPNELLKYLLTQATIHTFDEILPTMNEIFIKTVNSN